MKRQATESIEQLRPKRLSAIAARKFISNEVTMSEKEILQKMEGISNGQSVEMMLAKKHDPAT